MKQMLNLLVQSHSKLIELVSQYNKQSTQQELNETLNNMFRNTESLNYEDQNKEDIDNKDNQKKQDEIPDLNQEDPLYQCQLCDIQFFCQCSYNKHIRKYHQSKQQLDFHFSKKIKQNDNINDELKNKLGNN